MVGVGCTRGCGCGFRRIPINKIERRMVAKKANFTTTLYYIHFYSKSQVKNEHKITHVRSFVSTEDLWRYESGKNNMTMRIGANGWIPPARTGDQAQSALTGLTEDFLK